MPLSFPSSPAVGDYYNPGTRVWRWDGSVWQLVTPVQFAQVGQYVETITPTPVGHQRLLNGPAPLIALLLGLSSLFAWGQAPTVSKVMVDVKMSNGTFEERELTPVNDYVIGFDGSGNLVVKADSGGGGGGSGTVTSAAMTVPTGFSVAGSPITTTGTFAVTYTAGYQGYTTTEASKLGGIEAGADVTDAGNVAAAGALMTSTLGTGVQTALGVNVGSAGAPVLLNGAGGTPSSINLSNGTSLPITGITVGNWKLLYSNGSGVFQELTLGAAGTYLKSNGATSAPSFDTPSGGGGSDPNTVVSVNNGGTDQTRGSASYELIEFGTEDSDPSGDWGSHALTVASGEVWVVTVSITAQSNNGGNLHQLAWYQNGSLWKKAFGIGSWGAADMTMNTSIIIYEAGAYSLYFKMSNDTNRTIEGDADATWLRAVRVK